MLGFVIVHGFLSRSLHFQVIDRLLTPIVEILYTVCGIWRKILNAWHLGNKLQFFQIAITLQTPRTLQVFLTYPTKYHLHPGWARSVESTLWKHHMGLTSMTEKQENRKGCKEGGGCEGEEGVNAWNKFRNKFLLLEHANASVRLPALNTHSELGALWISREKDDHSWSRDLSHEKPYDVNSVQCVVVCLHVIV